MTQPQQPADPPEGGAGPDTDPAGAAPNGIPRGLPEHEPKGSPTSDRARTESAPHQE